MVFSPVPRDGMETPGDSGVGPSTVALSPAWVPTQQSPACPCAHTAKQHILGWMGRDWGQRVDSTCRECLGLSQGHQAQVPAWFCSAQGNGGPSISGGPGRDRFG